MGMKSKVSEKGGGERILAPEGPTAAICYQVIYLGHQETTFNGTTSWKPKFRFTFELPEHKHVFKEEEGEQPLVVSVEHNDSLNPKSNMYKFLKQWFPKKDMSEGADVDYSKLAGKKALISIVHNSGKGSNAGNVYANLGTIMPLPAGMACPDKPDNEIVIYDVDEHDEAVFEALPEFLRNKILASREMKEGHADVHAAASNVADDTFGEGGGSADDDEEVF